MPEIQELDHTEEVKAQSGGAEELIENLTRAWQDQEDATSVNGAVMRTSTTNLVIFSADAESAQEAEKVLPELSDTHPCRAVHLTAMEPLDAPLTASSHLHSKVEGGMRIITCEQVTLGGGLKTLGEMEGVIAPLLSPDLPVVLWWRGNPPFEGRAFERLIQAADRVIYDSAAFLESEEDLPWAIAMIDKMAKFDVSFTDVNWARLTPWRSLVAQFFDGAVQIRALDGIDRVVIEFSDRAVKPQRASCQSWLVLGWLATRLRWKKNAIAGFAKDGAVQFQLQREGGTVDVTLKRSALTDAPDGVTAVELHSSSPKNATYRVEYIPAEKCARTTTAIDGTPPLEMVVEMETEGYAALISNEMDLPGRDRMYEEALSFSATLQPPMDGAPPR